VAMCLNKNVELLTSKDQVLSQSNEYFEQHLNEGEERDQPPDQVDLRDDGVVIDLPLNNGGPQLVDPLDERGGNNLKAGPRGYCLHCPV
jgi:hypothetical protein